MTETDGIGTMSSTRFHLLTGGPGAGKTTLLVALAAAGHATMPEAGRSIIVEQRRIGGPALPWVDQKLYAEASLVWDIRSYRSAEQLDGPVFFDRGVIDDVCAFESLGEAAPAHVHAAARAFPYSPQVFLAPPWPEIYTEDTERRQTLTEAVQTYERLVEVYPRYGYELIELPRAPVAERVAFVLRTLAALDEPGGTKTGLT